MVSEFLSADGRIVAGYYQVRPRIRRVLRNLLQGLANLRWIDAPSFAVSALIPRHVFEFESELSNGGFVTTSNAEGASLVEGPPTVDAAFLQYRTPAAILLREHEHRLRSRLVTDRAVSLIAHSNLDEVRQMGLRLHAQKSAYRASIQWVSRTEMRTMSSDARLADEIFADVQTLLRQQGTDRAEDR
jgi:hypothetical protein